MIKNLVATLVFGCLAASSSSAMAAGPWWRVQTNAGVAECAKASAGGRILSCTQDANHNYRVRYYVTVNKWAFDGNAAGISITRDRDGRNWLIANDDSIWFRDAGGWHTFPVNRCEDGAPVRTRLSVGDHTIAVGHDGTNLHRYILERGGNPNTLRWWNGSCWWRMPVLPDGASAREVAIFDDYYTSNDSNPWVVSMAGYFYRWTGFAWTLVTGGAGMGVGGNTRKVIGLGDTSLWNYNQVTGSFAQDTTWTYGAIAQIGTYYDVVSLVHADGRLFWWQYYY